MLRSIIPPLVLAGLLLNASPVRAQSADTPDERTQYILRGLHPDRPAAFEGVQQHSVGTGFAVAPKALLTNDHVVRACAKVSVQIGGAGSPLILARVDAEDEQQDLALLRIDAPVADYALFEGNFKRVDPSELFIVGFPALGLPVIEPVLVTAEARPIDLTTTKPRLQFSGDVRHGNSGSPLFDNFGAVVGIVTQAIDSPGVYSRTGVLVTDIGVAVAGHTILDFLRKHAVAASVGERRTPFAEAERLPESKKIVARIVCWR
ncbi:MAG TPA: serine protease [Aliidongia sp.]|nr:serine protease [Aliidongia sp.]